MMKQKNELAGINSAEDLQREQRRLKLRIKLQEAELRKRIQQVPGELFFAGAKVVIPTVLSGKVTSSVFNVSRELINKAFLKNEGRHNSKLMAAVKQVGIFAALRFVYKAFISKK